MNAYYLVTQQLKTLLIADESINTVTKGDITRIDLDKKNIFPLAHIYVNSATITTTTITFNVSIFAMDLRNEIKIPVDDKFIGNDNEDDNLNSMLYVLIRLFLVLKKVTEDFEISNIEPFEPFTEARANLLDGWLARFDIELPIEEVGAC